MKIEPSKLGKALRELRDLQDITQKSLAERIGKTVNYISLLETGQRGASVDTINELAEALNVPPAFVMVLASDPGRKKSATARLMRTTQTAIRKAVGEMSKED